MSVRPHQVAQVLAQAAPGPLVGREASPFVYALAIVDAATGDVDFTLPNFATRLVDAWAVKTNATAAASANTLQVQTGAAAPVTGVMNMQVADQTVVRAPGLDDATHSFAANATLRVRRVKVGEDASAIVYVKLVRV